MTFTCTRQAISRTYYEQGKGTIGLSGLTVNLDPLNNLSPVT